MADPIPISRHLGKHRHDQLDSYRLEKTGGANNWLRSLALVVIGGGLAGYVLPSVSVPSHIFAMVSPGCQIKGNVSIKTGERIYHVPGQRRYSETVISPRYGERWFCSEAEARQAGWRKAHG